MQWPTVDSMTIMWETSEPASSRVDVLLAERIHSGYQGNYKKPEQVITTVSNEGHSKIHQLTVNGLEAGTVYFYQIHSGNGQSVRLHLVLIN
ncbi:fibronectin type III domain-containing protein [Paenibacillus uliginis]|nr:fibronectin type III domain-containing protein [Paenibacillus uliginis]